MSGFEGLRTLVLDRPAVQGLGTSVIGQEFVVVEDDLTPLAEVRQMDFLANSVPPTGGVEVAAFNSRLEEQKNAFQSFLEQQ